MANPTVGAASGLLLSTTSLGVRVDWTYAFVGPGKSLTPTAGTVALDVGGVVVPGIIDQHGQSTDQRCTAELAVDRPALSVTHLLGPLWRDAARGVAVAGRTLRLHVVTHRAPDFDAIVAIEVVRRWVQDGQIPAWLRELARFATSVDQGKFHADVSALGPGDEQRVALHECYLVAQHEASAAGTTDAALVAHGRKLLERFAAASDARRWHEVSDGAGKLRAPVLPVVADDPLTTGCVAQMRRAATDFTEDMQRARTEDVRVPVKLPDGEVATARVRGVALADEPRCVLFKYLARRAGFVLIAWPYRSLGRRPEANVRHPDGALERPDWFPRVVLSTNAETRVAVQAAGGRTAQGVPCLIGLGRRLEALEHLHEAATVRRRGGDPRYEKDYCDNGDPWYDGRGNDYTIVDGPRVGTALAYATVLRQVGFAGLPDGVAPDANRQGIEQGLDGAPGETAPPYWEPVFRGALSVTVQASSRHGPAPTEDLSPQGFKQALHGLWRRLCAVPKMDVVVADHVDQTMRYGVADSLAIEVHAVIARRPIGMARWAKEVETQRPAGSGTRVGLVHEVAAGTEVRGDRILRALGSSSEAGGIVLGEDVVIQQTTFVVRADGNRDMAPDWLVPLAHTAFTVEGLKAWRGWFRRALSDPNARPLGDLVQALARFWLWDSVWTRIAEPGDAKARDIVSTLRRRATLDTLIVDTRRLAERLDTVVQRLEAEQSDRASSFLNNTLFLLTGIGVAQFLQSLNTAPIVWGRDWWWALGVPAVFLGLLGWAKRTGDSGRRSGGGGSK